MTTLPLAQLGFGQRSDLAALTWLWLLYRRPAVFRAHMETLSRRARVRAGLLLLLYALPRLMLLACAGRSVLAAWLDQTHILVSDVTSPFVWAPVGAAVGTTVWALAGVNLGLTVGLLGTWILAVVGGFDLDISGDARVVAVLFGVAIGLVSRASGDPPWRWDWLAVGGLAGADAPAAPVASRRGLRLGRRPDDRPVDGGQRGDRHDARVPVAFARVGHEGGAGPSSWSVLPLAPDGLGRRMQPADHR